MGEPTVVIAALIIGWHAGWWMRDRGVYLIGGRLNRWATTRDAEAGRKALEGDDKDISRNRSRVLHCVVLYSYLDGRLARVPADHS